jgi:adenine-specific DNA-methyltransferase
MSTTAVKAPNSCKVYTPPELAIAMVDAIAGRNGTKAKWLEPCVGQGAFLNVLKARGIRPHNITAIDIEQDAQPCDKHARTLRPCDFFGWAAETSERFDRIVANPPFVRLRMYHRNLQPAIERLTSKVRYSCGSDGNAWLLFLFGSVHLLRKGGSLAFVLPAAWDYADYASVARSTLPGLFGEFEVHRSLRPLFRGVQEGAVVIVGRGFRENHQRSERFEHASAEELTTAVAGCSRPEPVARACGCAATRATGCVTKKILLGSLCNIRIGAVTGDSDYFLLTEDERLASRLPEKACVPVLSRARHLFHPYITRRSWEQLRLGGERIWLFRPNGAEISNRYVESYLAKLPEQGGCNRTRFKIKGRKPWYITPIPHYVDGFISGMSGFGPWICLNGFQGLVATNTLYVVEFFGNLSRDEKAACCLSLLSTTCRANMHPRRYADGLAKWEPGDLESLLIPQASATAGAFKAYREAISAGLRRGIEQASELADEWLESRNL